MNGRERERYREERLIRTGRRRRGEEKEIRERRWFQYESEENEGKMTKQRGQEGKREGIKRRRKGKMRNVGERELRAVEEKEQEIYLIVNSKFLEDFSFSIGKNTNAVS